MSTRRLLPPDVVADINKLSEIQGILGNMYLSKTEAAKVIGNRYELERLEATGQLKPTKGKRKWFCNAREVFRYANYKHKTRS